MHKALWLLLTCFLFLSNRVFAFSDNGHAPVQEKVYLHFDSNCYFAGDTIWYAAYVVRADNHCPTDMSRILYVELLNEQGYLVERQQLVVNPEGRTNGQFALNDSTWAGYYEVRAYTKWMLNWGEDVLFSRVLPVYEKPDEIDNYQHKAMPQKMTAGEYTIEYTLPKCNIRFYPEGGHLVYGLRSRVAFEISNEETRRLNLNGTLLKDDKEVMPIKCHHAGRGVFEFTPTRGYTYHARFELNGITYDEKLSGFDDEGSVLTAEQDERDIHITIKNSPLLHEEKRSLSVRCRGGEEARWNVNTTVPESRFTLPIDSLRSGVHDIVLRDSHDKMLLLRKIFVNRQDETAYHGNICYEKKPMEPYEKVNMTLDFGSAFGHQTLSMSVTDMAQQDLSHYRGNILTDLLLQSDIQGFVENASWYFEEDNEEKTKALDLLMMVQGWSRYDWDHLQTSDIKYEAEKHPSISGQMFDLNNRIWQNSKGRKALFATLFLKDDSIYDQQLGERTYRFRGAIYTDTLDRFHIEYEPFTGLGFLRLSGFYAGKLGKIQYDKKLHDPHIFIRCDHFYPDCLKRYSWYEMNLPPKKRTEQTGEEAYSIMLSEVTVKSKREKGRISMEPVASYDFNDFLNEYWDKGKYNHDFLFTNQNYDIESIINYLEWKIMQRNFSGKQAKVGILADGDYVDRHQEGYLDFLQRYSFLHRINKLQIITDAPRRPTFYSYSYPIKYSAVGSTAAVVGYINFQKYPGGEERFVEGRYIKLHGFSRPAEFYSPDYSKMPLPEVPDHRHTLYWNPSVTTDAEGRAHIEFYNNGVCTDMSVEVEGVTKDGKFIVSE